MSKRVIYEETDSEFCTCAKPNFVDAEVNAQNGGEIQTFKVGQYCTVCEKDKPPKEVSDEN